MTNHQSVQNTEQNKNRVRQLIEKGVSIPNPDSVEIGMEVDIQRISGSGVVLHSGTKIFGKSTLILNNTKIGYESPVTIENCQIGPEVDLKGGFFQEAVFLKKVRMGYGSHVRKGTILEEEASVAHTVALKQTILFPFVTLGSLINFCDCLMAGGTNPKNHSEVGSSFIHFNFTPNQDKATASLIGDVPGGVMLNQPPVFLGGQGGIVGPIRLAFGTVTAAGTISRKDELRPNRLILEGGRKAINMAYKPGAYQNVKRIVTLNINYMANLMALKQWYEHVRSLFISDDFPDTLLAGLKEKLDMGIDERLYQLHRLVQKMRDADKSGKHIDIYDKWDGLNEALNGLRASEGDVKIRDNLLNKIQKTINNTRREYIPVIQALDPEDAEAGNKWLQGIVDHVTAESLHVIPSFK